MRHPIRLILASQSPRRRELLSLLGLPFDIVTPQVNEQQLVGERPESYARRLSREKAQAVAEIVASPAIVLAADTIVVHGDDVLEKPRDADEATAMLKRLRARTHTVFTAVTLLDTSTGHLETRSPGSPVTMRNYSDNEIAAYVASGDPFDKAGAYAIQHEEFHPVEAFDGCFANVMGLPLCEVISLLQSFGVTLSADAQDRVRSYLSEGCPGCKALYRI
jgi:MAF protein